MYVLVLVKLCISCDPKSTMIRRPRDIIDHNQDSVFLSFGDVYFRSVPRLSFFGSAIYLGRYFFLYRCRPMTLV